MHYSQDNVTQYCITLCFTSTIMKHLLTRALNTQKNVFNLFLNVKLL